MKSRVLKLTIVISFFIGILIFESCEKEKIFPYPYENTVEEFYSIMEDYYLWIDSIGSFDSDDYGTPHDLLEAMRYVPRDKWSYITTIEEDAQYYQEGTYEGYGFGYTSDSENNLRITYLYENSDLKTLGITRGWKINKINGSAVDGDSNLSDLLASSSNSFEFESTIGTIVSETLDKKLISINTVVHSEVINVDSKNVGYFVFESFIGPSEDELNTLFEDFKTQQVEELVVDLRYNGGGMLSIVQQLAGLIVPTSLNDKKFLTYEFNDNVYSENPDINFVVSPNTLGLHKVYFIAGKGSASASEAIINGLAPYIETYIVGDDTYGKPVGMFSFSSRISNLLYVPICFRLVNSQEYGEYYNGLPADNYVEDDVLHDFGSEEAALANVLAHIETGSFPTFKSKEEIYRAPVKTIRTLEQIRGSI